MLRICCTACRAWGGRCWCAIISKPRARRSPGRRWRSAPADLWRYREVLPVRHRRNIVSLGENATPIIPLEAIGAAKGAANLWVKDEGRLPTGSFKARGLVMAIAMAKELGVATIAMPTNGNAGAAAAAYAARAGIEAVIFCPADTPEINVREIAAQGARVYRVNGLIDDCGKLIGQGAKERGWFDLSTLKEPYRIEGKKTMGLELAEQLDWQLPRRDLLSHRRRHRPHRHVEGLRRDGGARLDRPRAPAHGRGPGRGLRADRARLGGGRAPRDALGGCAYHSHGDPRCPRRWAIS